MKPLVIMCMWQRPENLDRILTALTRQTFKEFNFHIWNNNLSIADKINKSISNHSELNIDVTHSSKNLYGYARFLCVRKNTGNPVIFFDDDNIPKPDFIDYMVRMYKRHGKHYLISRYCRRMTRLTGYWNGEIAKPGEVCNYGGTGGMVGDRKIFDHPSILNQFPQEYRDVEDIWLSFLAYKKFKMRVLCVENKLIRVKDKKDQYKKLVAKKEKCTKVCFKKGWFNYSNERIVL